MVNNMAKEFMLPLLALKNMENGRKARGLDGLVELKMNDEKHL